MSGLIKVTGGTIHYLSFGKGENLVLLPSLWTSSWSYQKLGLALGKHYRVFIPDLFRGKSRFSHPATKFSDFVPQIYEFAQKLHLRSFYLVGVSLSGVTAIHFAKRYPSLVKKLYLVNTTADPLEMNHRFLRLAWGYPKLFYHNLSSVRGIKTNFFWLADGFLGLLRHPVQMIWDARLATSKFFPKQTEFPVPSKLLFAKQDEFVPYRFVESMKQIKNLEIEVQDRYHCWFFGREEELVETMRDFLK